MSDVIDMEEKRNDFPVRKFIRTGIVLVIIAAIIAIVVSNLFIAREGEYKVVRQFGEIVDIKKEPGLYFKIPFIQTVESLPKYQMTFEMHESEISTLDKKRMMIDNYSLWRIVDPQKMITSARTVANVEARMGDFIYSVVRAELGRLNYVDIINDEDSSRGSLNDIVTERVNQLLQDGNFGIEVIDVRIKRTDLPTENEQSVYTRMISERQSTAQNYLSQGEADKNKIMAETDREVRSMLAKAQADAEVIRAEGEGEAARIYNEAFSKDPEFYNLYRTLESYKKTINDQTMIILPADSPYARLLQGYLE